MAESEKSFDEIEKMKGHDPRNIEKKSEHELAGSGKIGRIYNMNQPASEYYAALMQQYQQLLQHSKEQHYERLASFLSANSIDGTSTIIEDNNQKTNNNNNNKA
ncbi:hypothetical protein SO802_004596 [Lithocarpus litseifolius]|uniref:Uncharacterized protein n=1 Tax=Lithocarpus litseifolius TaxID=425828 RepID=A0AAW2E3E8_9ROSI